MTDTPPDSEHVAALLAQAGQTAPVQVMRLPDGANNRVYRIDTERGPLLLKAYYQHADDPRNRLQAEFGFLRFAWERGLRCLPRPLACDREHNLGLYEFIDGRRLTIGEIGRPEVRQALDFFVQLNRHKSLPEATVLPPGSEACFSLAEHLACVDRRLERLRQLIPATPLDHEAADLVQRQLLPAWEQVRRDALAQASALTLTVDLPLSDRCLSPSDFGFHNALVAGDGCLRFIDFEYAGWDDPAKTVCDFFCQPAVPVPPEFWPEVADAIAATLSNPSLQRSRFALLRPVYQVKWCCIMLNEFLPVDGHRRSFARGREDVPSRKQNQFDKVQAALQQLPHEDAHGLR